MLNLPSIFSCYRQNESGRLIMSPLLWHCVYVGRNKLLFLWGELEKKKSVCNLCTTVLSSGVTVKAGGL